MTRLAFFYRLLLWLYFPFLLALCAAQATLLVLAVIHSPDLCGVVFMLLAVVALGVPLLHVGLTLLRVAAGPWRHEEAELRLPRPLVLELYELVWQVARDHRLRPADEIRLAADTVAHVYEEGKGHRVLVIGAVALATFSQDTLAGVIAHELAHFTAGDTRRLRHRAKTAECMARLDDAFARQPVSKLNPLVWLIGGYHLLYRVMDAAHSRQQEYAADRATVAQAGKETAAASLILLNVPERLPRSRLSTVIEECAAEGRTAGQIFAEQVKRARATSRSEWEDALKRELKQPTETFDSHPALKDRLAAIGVSPRKALRLALDQSGPPAHEMIPAWEEVEKLLAESLIEPYREYYLLKRDIAQVLRGRPHGRV
jgi:Zn-dependent protease with chaperone function